MVYGIGNGVVCFHSSCLYSTTEVLLVQHVLEVDALVAACYANFQKYSPYNQEKQTKSYLEEFLCKMKHLKCSGLCCIVLLLK